MEDFRMNKRRWEVLSDLLNTLNLSEYSIAEIGVFEGKTCQYLVDKHEFRNYFLIDPYSDYSEYDDSRADSLRLEDAYQKILKIVDKNECIQHFKMFSTEAISNVQDNSLDLVFIDANHDYLFVKQDIELWKKKVKQGGIIAGHDYNYPGITGVKKAVDEFFGDRVKLESDYVWYVNNRD